jgi:hypothetical protein
MYMPESLKNKNRGFFKYLICIDIISRKAYIYPIKTKRVGDILIAYDIFLSELKTDIAALDNSYDAYMRNLPFSITADDGFNTKAFIDRNKELGIPIDTQTAKDDHISAGNRLGIIDRFTRTIKSIISRYVNSGINSNYIKELKELINNYNNTEHASLHGLTPNDVFSSRDARYDIMKQGMEINNRLLTNRYTFNPDDKVRAITKQTDFEKEGPRFSSEIYEIVDQIGSKYKIRDISGKIQKKLYKLHELQSVDVDKIQKLPKASSIRKTVQNNKASLNIQKKLRREGIDSTNLIVGAERSRTKVQRQN